MPETGTVVVRGYTELLRAYARTDAEAKRALRAELRVVGGIVRDAAAAELSPLSPNSARTLRVVVRQRGVSVEQSRNRVTGKRPDWAARQLKDLDDAAQAKEGEVTRRLETTLDLVLDGF